ncbi:hypothetical protein BsWGS_12253 [Bradybaena similaris]
MSQAISDDVMPYLHISLNIVARTIISVVGMASNLINMIIFAKLGLKDSMSVGLFSLSLTDFLVTGIQLASCISFIIDLLCPNTSTDVRFLGYYTLAWATSALYDVSCWITAFVSAERCCCVVSPFKVKLVFTRCRCIVVTLTIYAIYIGMHVPIFIIDRMKSVETISLLGNSTTTGIKESMFSIILNPEIVIVEYILNFTAGVPMWFASQAAVIVCAVWMGYSLETSSKVRHKTGSDSKTDRQLSVHSKHSSTLSNRERRLVNVVLVLAITLTCCNIPTMITTTVYYTFPGTSTYQQENLSSVLWALAYTFSTFGCSIGFVVYLKLNASYRREFDCLFRRYTPTSVTTINNIIGN